MQFFFGGGGNVVNFVKFGEPRIIRKTKFCQISINDILNFYEIFYFELFEFSAITRVCN